MSPRAMANGSAADASTMRGLSLQAGGNHATSAASDNSESDESDYSDGSGDSTFEEGSDDDDDNDDDEDYDEDEDDEDDDEDDDDDDDDDEDDDDEDDDEEEDDEEEEDDDTVKVSNRDEEDDEEGEDIVNTDDEEEESDVPNTSDEEFIASSDDLDTVNSDHQTSDSADEANQLVADLTPAEYQIYKASLKRGRPKRESRAPERYVDENARDLYLAGESASDIEAFIGGLRRDVRSKQVLLTQPERLSGVKSGKKRKAGDIS